MAITIQASDRDYSDLDLNFKIHPVKRDINKLKGGTAVVASVKNLLLTNHYERPFQPDLGCNIRGLLFENLDMITASNIEREIIQTINNFEPRVTVQRLEVIPDFDNNGFRVTMEFLIVNQTESVTVSFLLERVR
jgi:phage baseplate assembly protein W